MNTNITHVSFQVFLDKHMPVMGGVAAAIAIAQQQVDTTML
jgi:CheY-like chemotaxis protein